MALFLDAGSVLQLVRYLLVSVTRQLLRRAPSVRHESNVQQNDEEHGPLVAELYPAVLSENRR